MPAAVPLVSLRSACCVPSGILLYREYLAVHYRLI